MIDFVFKVKWRLLVFAIRLEWVVLTAVFRALVVPIDQTHLTK